jgi:UDP-4-amino-4,6-dideoxy-N-acetyl-beta-L-altrosamine N-acetyltransferase
MLEDRDSANRDSNNRGPAGSLRSLSRDDLEMVLAWRNQDSVRAVMFTDHLISWEEHVAWFERDQADDTTHYRIFETDGRPVGFTSISGLDRRNGTASIGLYIGASDVPKGTGSLLLYAALDWAFFDLGVRKLSCEALDFNERALRLYEKFGFRKEGVLRKQRLKGTLYRDVVVLGLLADEWREIRLMVL